MFLNVFVIFHIFEKHKHNTIREILFDIPYFSLTVWYYMEYDNLYSEGMLYFYNCSDSAIFMYNFYFYGNDYIIAI